MPHNNLSLPESQASTLRAMGASLGGGLAYCAAGLWTPWIMAAVVGVLYSCGVGAMSLHQYSLAAGFYFVAIGLIAWRISAHAKTTEQATGAIIITMIVAALAFSGSVYWILHTYQTETHEPNLVLRVAAGIWVRVRLLKDLPWYWILSGFVIGVLLATLSHVTRTRRQFKALVLCPDERAHALLTDDLASIAGKVRLTYIAYRPDFEKSHVDFSFFIINISLYDIIIRKTLGEGSFITYDFGECDHPRFQYPPLIETNKTILCKSRGTVGFVVRQPIRKEGLETRLKTEDALIQFGGLDISFDVVGEPDLKSKKLETRQQVLETRKQSWSGDDPAIVFGLTEEQWVALQSGQIERLAELKNLKRKVETLERELQTKDESVPLAGPDIIARDPYFALVGKETPIGKYVKVGRDLPHYSQFVQAGFVEFFCKPTEGTVNGIDLAATIHFKHGQRVNQGAWYLRDSEKVPFRHNETQTLFLILYDRKFFTYENQPRGRPIENSISQDFVYAHIHLFGAYEDDGKTKPVNINWWVRLSMQDEQLSADNIDEATFNLAD